MAPPHTLIQLPREISQTLSALLEPEERRVAARVCRAAASSVVFNPPREETLVLPPTDEARARRLLTNLSRKDPARLARFQWIQIAAPWHVDLLIDVGVADAVHNVRVRTEVDLSQQAVETICDKLVALARLWKLDLSGTRICNVNSVANMTQLRHLDLSRTEVVDAAPLSALVLLEELVFHAARVKDMACIRNVSELRRLEVTGGFAVEFPSLRALTKLHTLRIAGVTIESRTDFVESLVSLKQLLVGTLYDGSGRPSERGNRQRATVDAQSLVQALPQLEIFQHSCEVSAAALARMPALRVFVNTIHTDAELLAALPQLEQLSLNIPSRPPLTGQTDYHYLQRFPALKKMTVHQSSTPRDIRLASAEMQTLLNVLAAMPRLENLQFQCIVDSSIIPPLVYIKHLSVNAQSELKSFKWIMSCRALRSLSVHVDPKHTDSSAIGSLTQLEDLFLRTTTSQEDEPDDLSFLAPLVNLKKLMLSCNMSDLAVLCGMTQLRELSIASFKDLSMLNVDVLGRLPFLSDLKIPYTSITDLTPLMNAKRLRRVVIAGNADCRPLRMCDHPTLLHILHPDKNCLWSCTFGTSIQEGEDIQTRIW